MNKCITSVFYYTSNHQRTIDSRNDSDVNRFTTVGFIIQNSLGKK